MSSLVWTGIAIAAALALLALWAWLWPRKRIRASDAQQAHVVTSRGFKHMEPVPSGYGGEVAVYESSAASHPHVWLMVTCPSSLNDPRASSIEAVAHLTVENATRLRDQLGWLVDNHYQRPFDRDVEQALDVIAEPDRRRAEHLNRTLRRVEGGDEL